jgi:hypothetical protein
MPNRTLRYVVLLLALTATGCNGKSSGIVGKWHVCGNPDPGYVEFFSDGKVAAGGQFGQYRMVGNELQESVGLIPFEKSIVVSFPDAEHMDWEIVTQAGQNGTPQTTIVRFERIRGYGIAPGPNHRPAAEGLGADNQRFSPSPAEATKGPGQLRQGSRADRAASPVV